MKRVRMVKPDSDLNWGKTQDFTRARRVRQELGEKLWEAGLHIRQLREPGLRERFPALGNYEGPFFVLDYLPEWDVQERTQAVVFDEIKMTPLSGDPPDESTFLETARHCGRALADIFYELHEPALHLPAQQREQFHHLLLETLDDLSDVPDENTVLYSGHAPLDDALTALRTWFTREYLPPALWTLIEGFNGTFTEICEDSYQARMREPWLHPSRLPALTFPERN